MVICVICMEHMMYIMQPLNEMRLLANVILLNERILQIATLGCSTHGANRVI